MRTALYFIALIVLSGCGRSPESAKAFCKDNGGLKKYEGTGITDTFECFDGLKISE